MSTAPTDDPPAQDPWAAPAAKRTAAPAKTGIPTQRGLSAGPGGPTTPQQLSRQEKLKASQARYRAQMTWPMVVRWTLAGAITRFLCSALLFFLAYQHIYLHGLLVSPTTTADQWNSAYHTARDFSPLAFLYLFFPVVTAQGWQRTRAYLSKLPGLRPHALQATKDVYRMLEIPAYWPPVPEGATSWTLRLPWRVPATLTTVAMLLTTIGQTLVSRTVHAPAAYQDIAVMDLIAGVLLLITGVLDLVRLREYSRWPGRV